MLSWPTSMPSRSDSACSTAVSSISVDAVVASRACRRPRPRPRCASTLGVPSATPTGAGIGVAVIDSGIASSADFGNRFAILRFHERREVAAAVRRLRAWHTRRRADCRHRQPRWIHTTAASAPARVDRHEGPRRAGCGRTSDVIRAVEYATAQRAKLGVEVINLSLGHAVYEPAARILWCGRSRRHHVPDHRRGRSGEPGIECRSRRIGYGGSCRRATRRPRLPSAPDDERHDEPRRRRVRRTVLEGRRGTTVCKTDIVAPGHGLVSVAASNSTLYTRYPTSRVGTNYLRLSGTSMAAAVASGTVALLLEANKRPFQTGRR